MASTGGGGGTAARAAEAAAARPFLSDNEMWEAFGGRAVGRIVYGGAEIGECRAAVAATGDGGRTNGTRPGPRWPTGSPRPATPSAARGRAVSAREAWLRAAAYYQVAYFPLFGNPVDPRLVAAFDKETAVSTRPPRSWIRPSRS